MRLNAFPRFSRGFFSPFGDVQVVCVRHSMSEIFFVASIFLGGRARSRRRRFVSCPKKKFFPPSGKAQVGQGESFRFFTSIGEKRKRKYFGEINFSALVLCESKSQRKSVEGGHAARSFWKKVENSSFFSFLAGEGSCLRDGVKSLPTLCLGWARMGSIFNWPCVSTCRLYENENPTHPTFPGKKEGKKRNTLDPKQSAFPAVFAFTTKCSISQERKEALAG